MHSLFNEERKFPKESFGRALVEESHSLFCGGNLRGFSGRNWSIGFPTGEGDSSTRCEAGSWVVTAFQKK